MTERSFLGLAATDWSAVGTVVNAVVVVVLARYTYRYMQSTAQLVDSANDQAAATLEQAKMATRTLQLLISERQETDSYQRAVFISELDSLRHELWRLENVVTGGSKPFRQADVFLIPEKWEDCRAFVSRHAHERLDEMLAMETNLSQDGAEIMGVVRAPDSLWLSTFQRRADPGQRLGERRRQIENFKSTILHAALPNPTPTPQ